MAINSLSSVALSGMQAARTQLDASANNIANVNTEGYHRQEVAQTEQPQGGVTAQVKRAAQAGSDLESDVVAQLQGKNAFLANLAVFKTDNKMKGQLLDVAA